MSPLARQQVMFKYQALIKDNLKDVARLITLEQGKTLADAEGDVMRGLQVCAREIVFLSSVNVINLFRVNLPAKLKQQYTSFRVSLSLKKS